MTDQKIGRLGHALPSLIDSMSDRLNFLLPTVTLQCVDAVSARRVMNAFPNRRRGGRTNTMKLDGSSVVITYTDKMWPYDIADWAREEGLASNSDAEKVFACL